MKRLSPDSEEVLSLVLADYMRLKYPDVLWHFDYGSGLKMTMSQAARQKRLNKRAWPDLFIPVPVWPEPDYCYNGLFVELKRAGTRLKRRDGSWASPHIEEQAAVLDQLAEVGYIAQFACGIDEAREVIDSYLGAAA